MKGLSPLTRGNRSTDNSPSFWWGPIPAHAGEPNIVCGSLAINWAYPRSRGGTPKPPFFNATVMGLSPLTRGNRSAAVATTSSPGPIPAHAGEPHASESLLSCMGAYPRSRGGTPMMNSFLLK